MGHGLPRETSVVLHLGWKYIRGVHFSPSIGPLPFPGFGESGDQSRGKERREVLRVLPQGRYRHQGLSQCSLGGASPIPSNCEPWVGLGRAARAVLVME